MKLTEYEKINAERYKYKLIVDRLKKYIEDNKDVATHWMFVEELQKILGEKNETPN